MRTLLPLMVAWCFGSVASAQDAVAYGTALASETRMDGVSQPVDVEAYRVGPRDVLSIQVFDESNLTGDVVVSDDGTIDMALTGKVMVKGRTLQEVDQLVTGLLAANYLVDPQVSVSVQTFGSRPVEVLGSVNKPGQFQLTGPTSLSTILAMAGGVLGEPTEVRITGRGGDPVVVKLDQLMDRGQENVPLAPGDTVYVPQGLVVYVSGQVEKPGAVSYRDGMTVTQALIKAGGAKTTASLRRAYVLRAGERIQVNVRRILKGQEADVALRPDDQLFVEESLL